MTFGASKAKTFEFLSCSGRPVLSLTTNRKVLAPARGGAAGGGALAKSFGFLGSEVPPTSNLKPARAALELENEIQISDVDFMIKLYCKS